MTPAALADERRRGRLAGLLGVVGLVASLASVACNSRAVARTEAPGPLARELVSMDVEAGAHALAFGLRLAGLAATIAVGLFLVRAVLDRDPGQPAAMRWLTVAAPIAVAVSLIAGFAELHHLSDRYSALAAAGQTEAVAADLLHDGTAIRLVTLGDIAAHVVFGVWVSLVSLAAMRVGLLTRFLGIWGVGAGLSGVLLPMGDALFIGWLGSVTALALGWWPGGRPPAWDEGRAISWTEADARQAGSWRANAP